MNLSKEQRIRLLNRVKDLYKVTQSRLLDAYQFAATSKKGAVVARDLNMLRVRATLLCIARNELRRADPDHPDRPNPDFPRHAEKIALTDGWGHLAGCPPIVLEVTPDLHHALAVDVLTSLFTPFESYLELTIAPTLENAVRRQLEAILGVGEGVSNVDAFAVPVGE